MKNYTLKKRILSALLLIGLCTSVCLAGCDSGSDDKSGTTAPADQTQETETSDTDSTTTEAPILEEKPIIYIYGEEDDQEVDVTLSTDRKIICEYPARPDGENTWYVKADRDGTLSYYPTAADRDADTQVEGLVNEYSYLYWEGKSTASYDFSKGFCVAGRDSAYFLDEKLAELGLNREEANEFIVYWLPKLQANAYNIISFQTEAYTDEFRLTTKPAADHMLRVFMAFKPSDKEVDLPQQDLSSIRGDFSRDGLTVVEWGGAQLKK